MHSMLQLDNRFGGGQPSVGVPTAECAQGMDWAMPSADWTFCKSVPAGRLEGRRGRLLPPVLTPWALV